MNLRDLKYLIALSDHRHFGKASKACFVSQPALSMQIKKLEDTLGIKLLERTNKSVLLTDVGKTIVQHARKIVIQAEEIREIAKYAKNPEQGVLQIGIFPTIASYLLPHIFYQLCTAFPGLKIYLIESKASELLEKLKQGKLDSAILATPISDPDLKISLLFEETLHLGISQANTLAQKTVLQSHDLQSQTLLLLEEDHHLRDQAFNMLHDIPTFFYATSLEALRHMVASNVGITLMPALARRSGDGITYPQLEHSQKPTRSISMVWRDSYAKSALVDKIAGKIRDILKEANISDGIFISKS